MKYLAVGEHGCILDLLFVLRDISFIIYLYLVTDGVCDTRLSHIWELATPPIWGLPSYYIWYPKVSPPDTWATWYLIWFDLGSWWITVPLPYALILYSLTLILPCIVSVHHILIHYCYLLPLYLFTGLFKLSRIFFSLRQVPKLEVGFGFEFESLAWKWLEEIYLSDFVFST